MSSRQERITQQRLDSLSKLRARGINPYPHSFHRSHSNEQAVAAWKQQGEGAGVLSVAGRVRAKRKMGKMAFIDIRDGSGKLQLCFRYNLLGQEKYDLLQEIDIGDIIGAQGRLFQTKAGEISLSVTDFTMLSKSLRPLPEKWHGLADIETRYRQRYLDLIINEETRTIFILRSKIIAAIRDFLNARNFVEVETPILQGQAGGALALPFTTHHNALDRDLYLRIALELHLKRLIVGNFDRVYEMGRTFRNEGISVKHNPEFTLLECYQAYADYNDMMSLVENMVSCIARDVLGDTRLIRQGKTIDLSPPWQRVSLSEAIKSYSGIDLQEYPDAASLRTRMVELGMTPDAAKGRGKLIDELTNSFVEPNLTQPTFLLDYPLEMSPLAKRKRGNEQLTERFEVFIDGMELANAFTELNDPVEQRERFLQQLHDRQREEEIELIDEDFLQAMEQGMPPTGGLGIGIDRLVMLLTEQTSIREVILFPQLKAR